MMFGTKTKLKSFDDIDMSMSIISMSTTGDIVSP